ncbi:MAG: phosphopentomutase [Actinobacteria bacterium]|nr:MAG: phosphopentomutase [Actinomycetota bacterium]
MSRRATVVVLDACGVGALPDAYRYGDEGADTLGHLAATVGGGLRLPVLERLGLGSIVALEGVAPSPRPVLHGRLRPLGAGKDSTAGHWELMGVVSEAAPPTYPQGVPAELVAELERAMGHRVTCNAAYNGVAAIEHYGTEHLRSGRLILYTSVDSVLQLAAHTDRVPPEQLYGACRAARAVMRGEHAVGRVIARPFTGEPGRFHRTLGRRDYALAPPARSYLQELDDAGVAVHSVGKIADLFAGVGTGAHHPAANNAQAIAAIDSLLQAQDDGLIFANLVETDQVYGHRQDIPGFARALELIDAAVGGWLGRLHEGDLLVITADHGCDPTTPGTDHTREYAPLLAVFGERQSNRHDGALADVGASALRWLAPRVSSPLPGRPFLS